MGLEKGGWNKREVDAAKGASAEYIEAARKRELGEIAADHQTSVEDVKTIQVAELPDGERRVSGTLNGVDISISRTKTDRSNVYEGSANGKALLESDAKDVFRVMLGIANRRDQVNAVATRDSIDEIEAKFDVYEKNVGALLNRALGHTLNPDASRQDKVA